MDYVHSPAHAVPPPALYSHPPRGLIVRTTPERVDALCRHHTYACAVTRGALLNGKPFGCLIVVPYGAGQDVVNHEIAHCNGWRHKGDS
jgi:hypothetical protein